MYDYAKEKFLQFINSNFDINDKKIEHKLNHTFHVVDNAIYICNKMNLSNEDKNIAMIIALLHDIGRFEQAKEFKSFREDITNFDHATLGTKILFEKNLIRTFLMVNFKVALIFILHLKRKMFICQNSNLKT